MDGYHHSKTYEAVEFERLTFALLSAEALAEGKTILVGNEVPRSYAFVDGYAPSGILSLPGPCFIEVKLRLTDRIFKSIEEVRRVVSEDFNFLIVLRENRYSEGVIREITDRFPGVSVHVIGRDKIKELAAKHPAAALPFQDGSIDQALFSFRSRTDDSPRVLEQHLNALRSAYNDDKLALVIGAGVSRSANLPDWPELVRRLAATVFDSHSGVALTDDERLEVQSFFESEVPASPLIVARLLQNSLRDEFAGAVRTALYREPQQASRLLDQLGELCMPLRDRVGIVGVVNYNFDDLLEVELSHRGISHRSVYTEGDKPLKSELPIYHVHGFLPRNGHLNSTHQDALVLSEDAYHAQFTDPFVWPNIIQLNLFRNNVCLFIGISMTDPNQRRLLEITSKKDSSVRHYAILRDHWTGPQSRRLSESAKSLARVFKGLEESSLASLGVTVLWVDSHDEIPAILKSIRR